MKSPEQIHNGNNHPSIEDRAFSLISKMAEEHGNLSEDEINKIKIFQSMLPTVFSSEAEKYLLSLDDADFQTIIFHVFRDITNEAKREGAREYYSGVTVDDIKNAVLYQHVRGYGHPDLEKRIESNPIPTVTELMLGCYIEQIEEQTRNAVLTMRSKGYDTVQSGFYHVGKGSQFFDIYEDIQSQVPDSLIDDMLQKYGVTITTERSSDRTNIILTPSHYKDIQLWQEALDYFADAMPSKNEEGFNAYGMGVDFAYKTIKQYPIETILASTVTERQKELVEKLYACKTKEDIIRLFNTEPDTAEQMIIDDALESDVNEFKKVQSLFSLYSHVSDKESMIDGLDLIKNEFALLSEKYRKTEDKQQYLATIERAIRYIQGHLNSAK